MEMLFSENDYRQLEKGETYEGKFVIIKPDYFKPEYRSANYQLFHADGVFGCDPSKLGNAVFGRDFEEMYRQERYNILGVATEAAIREWERVFHMSREVMLNSKPREFYNVKVLLGNHGYLDKANDDVYIWSILDYLDLMPNDYTIFDWLRATEENYPETLRGEEDE